MSQLEYDAIAGDLRMLHRMPVHFLTPNAKTMADLMAILEEQWIVARIDTFYPVFNVESGCNSAYQDDCHLAEERSGVVLEGSSSADRPVLSCATTCMLTIFLVLEEHTEAIWMM